MDLLIEALKALGLIAGTVAIVILAPLVVVVVFSLVSGFNDSVPGDE